MTDNRTYKLAEILVDHSTRIQRGDRVLIEGTTAAMPLITALYELILTRGGHPHPMVEIPEQQEMLFTYGEDHQLEHVPPLRKLAYESFESRIRIHSSQNTRALSSVDPEKQKTYQKSQSPILATQLKRGATKAFKWLTTLYPTEAYAMEAEMGLRDYQDFVFSACHADEADPIAYWDEVLKEQARIVERIEGRDKVQLRGPNVDLTLSIKDRTFVNAAGEHNMPDGEIYTGPVEDSVNGWVRFTYPAMTQGRIVEGIELKFKDGKVIESTAQKNEAFLLQMLDSDDGARYVGEFAIGTNFQIDRFTGNILFDEKIGGSFHMAVGAGYPETGSKNKSMIHWDMICDMRQDSEITADGDVIYRNGEFLV